MPELSFGTIENIVPPQDCYRYDQWIWAQFLKIVGPKSFRRSNSRTNAIRLAPMHEKSQSRHLSARIPQSQKVHYEHNNPKNEISRMAPRRCEISVTRMKTITEPKIVQAHKQSKYFICLSFRSELKRAGAFATLSRYMIPSRYPNRSAFPLQKAQPNGHFPAAALAGRYGNGRTRNRSKDLRPRR